jgi:anaerobic dimethyl sulfoxide reductase subunit A
MHADIILPSTAMVERNEIPGDSDRDREIVLVYSKIGGELYESKSDQWIQEQVLKRLGYDPADVFPYSEEQRFFTKLATTKVNRPNGKSVPLVSITKMQIQARKVDGKPQQGVSDIDELMKQGIYQVRRKKNDGYTHVAYQDFIDDPKKHALSTKSGKFEIYCQAKADVLNRAAMDGETYKPYPTYHKFPGTDGYPLLMFTPHYPCTACSDFGNVKTLRDAWTAPVTLSAQDAASIGVQTGDAVLVSSPYGKIARTCAVSQMVIPGAINVPNGSWPQFDDDGVDRGGSPNTLYGGKAHGMGVSGCNNVSVKVEKWAGDQLAADADTQVLIDVQA